MRQRQVFNLCLAVGMIFVLGIGGSVVRQVQALETSPPEREQYLSASSSFTYHSIKSNYAFCTAIATTDLNSDGLVDIVTGSEDGTGRIDRWMNAGGGTFSPGTPLSTGKNGATVLFGSDLNDDGRTDVALISSRSHTLAVLEQMSNGSWTRHEPLMTSTYPPISLATTEVRLGGDAYLPVGVSGSYAGTYLVPWPVGNRLAMKETANNYPAAVYPSDIDRDGDVDYVVADFYRNGVSWTENLGGGATTDHAIDRTFFRTVWLRPADIDNDGDPDVVAASDSYGLVWWANNGSGSGWTRYAITAGFYRSEALALADLDADGDIDLVAATERQLVWLENLGHPQAGTHNWIQHVLDNSPYGPYVVAVGDIDRDGRPDIVSCDLEVKMGNGTTSGRRLGWWENKRQAVPAAAMNFKRHDIDTTLTGAWGVDLADFNGDGALDVVASGYGASGVTGETRLYKNPGTTAGAWSKLFTASFDKGRGVTAYQRGRNYQLGNGHPAFVVSGDTGGGQARAFWSDDWNWSTSLYQAARLTGLGTAYQSAVGDVDGDGVLDVVSASANQITLWDGGSNTKSVIDNNCRGARAVCLGDIDGDGRMDVGAACANENYIVYLRQTGNPSHPWDRFANTTLFSGATDITCGDIDGNGRADLVAASPGPPGQIAALGYPGVAGGTYTWLSVTTDFTGTEHLALGDIDRDGDLDVVATSASLGKVAWFENTGSGFTKYEVDESVGSLREIAIGDINGDGAPDIVVVSQDRKLVRWYEQQVSTDLSINKSVDTMHSTGVISTGESIPYVIEVTNNGLAGDVRVIDRWEPSNAVVAASSDEDCVTDISHGVMTCTLSLPAGRIEDVNVVLTPSLLFDGYITNTAQVLAVAPFLNTNLSYTNTATSVEVQQNMAIWDGVVRYGEFPVNPIFPGESFTYTIGMVSLGPKSSSNATIVNTWGPLQGIDGMVLLGVNLASSVSTMADYDCSIDSSSWELRCDLTDLGVNAPITLTVAITTSSQFTSSLETNLSLVGPDGDEGNASNNQSWPLRVGMQPYYKVYLPLTLRAP